MSKRKSQPKERKADIVALGKSLANAAVTAHDRLTYWWNQLHPDRKPVTVDIQIVDNTVLPIKSKDVPPTPDELRQYFVARLGYSLADYDAMTLAEVVAILTREVENREPADDAPPDYLMSQLSKREGQLLTYLWTKPMARINALHASVWSGKAVTDEAIMKAAERLNNKLAEMPDYCHITVKHLGAFIVLDK